MMSFLQYSHEDPKFCQSANAALEVCLFDSFNRQILVNGITEFNNDREIYETLCSTMKTKDDGNMQEENVVLSNLIVIIHILLLK